MLALPVLLAASVALSASPDTVTILHTNDWQSRLLGAGPNAEYTPDSTDDDDTVGGVARLADLIQQRRAAAGARGPVLLVDGGDVTMGTLFHTIAVETGTELQLMRKIGYDAVTLGNHEFDFRPEGFARMVRAAQAGGGAPPLLATNLVTDPADPRDDGVEALFADGSLKRSLTLDKGGLRVGLLGVMGADATEVMGQADPLTTLPLSPLVQEEAARLRGAGADLVVVLSHSGVESDPELGWVGEEVTMMAASPDVDVVVGGHSHTPLVEPILVEGRPVVQAGSDTRWLGELVLRRSGARWAVEAYTLHPVDDSMLGDIDVIERVDAAKDLVTERVLQPLGYTFDQPLAVAPRTLTRAWDDHVLGNLVTDAFREAAAADVAVTGNGTLRADVRRGRTGVQRVSDLFRISGLGVGTLDDSPGYALVKLYVTGSELKDLFEFLLIGYQLKGDNYYPRVSGAQVVYNTRRVPFDHVVEVHLGDDARGYAPIELDDSRRYSVAVTTYVGTFLPKIAELSYGLLRVVPKDAQGVLVKDMDTQLVDRDPSTPGIQETKAWQAVLDHLSGLPDLDQDGLADLPSGGQSGQPRLLRRDSWALRDLVKNASWRTWAAAGLAGAVVVGVGLGAVWGWRRRRRR